MSIAPSLVRWTVEEDDELRRVYRVESFGEMARRFGRTRKSVQKRMSRLGLFKHGDKFRAMKGRHQPQPATRRGNAWWSMEEDKLLGMLCRKLTNDQLAERLGRTRAAVRKRMLRLGLTESGYSAHPSGNHHRGSYRDRPDPRPIAESAAQAEPAHNAYWAARVRAAHSLRAVKPEFTFEDLGHVLDAVDAQWEARP